MSEYVKKPVVIEAIEYNGENGNEIAEFMKCMYPAYDENKNILIGTLEGVMSASKGDFIIKGVKGEFYPCKPDIFEKTYSAYQPKRKPLPDGTLPLTESELEEFSKLNGFTVKDVQYDGTYIHLNKRDYMGLCYVAAIKYILDQFDLENKNEK